MTTMKSMNTKTNAIQDIQGAITYHKHYDAAQMRYLTGNKARQVLNAFEYPIIGFGKSAIASGQKPKEAWTSRQEASTMSFQSYDQEMKENLVHV